MNKRTKLIAACLAVAAAGVFALAQVNPGLFVFRSGTPIMADEVNANFTLLQERLEEARAQLATATAALAELEQQVADFEATPGPEGPEGPSGADGADGAPGPRGPQGPAGTAGPAGADGADGDPGPVGPQGPAGSDGADGAVGPAGPEGPQGPAGPAGADGAVGPAGPQGPIGPEGPEGPQGPAGADGTDGAEGPAGPEGAVGNQGPEGPAGPAGPEGPEGPAGADGAAGPTGPEGPQGLPGPDGQIGPMGEPGRMKKEVINGPGNYDIILDIFEPEDTFYLVLGNPTIQLPPGAAPNQILEFMGNDSSAHIHFLGNPPRVADDTVDMSDTESFHQTSGLATHFRLVWVDNGNYWLWASL